MARDISAATVIRWLGRSGGPLHPSEQRVVERALEGRTITRDVRAGLAAADTFGDRLADDIARIGGSWGFIIAFFVFLLVWVALNTVLLTREPFDPYPFIFLNLVLSMLAAIQAPIIMMSQNRAATRDRLDASHDYEINLKAEIEILALHDKLDAMRRDDAQNVAQTLASIDARLAEIEGRLAEAGRG